MYMENLLRIVNTWIARRGRCGVHVDGVKHSKAGYWHVRKKLREAVRSRLIAVRL